MPAATIFEEIVDERLNTAKLGPVDDRAALPLAAHEARSRQHREMGRHRVLRHCHQAGKVTSRDPLGLFAHEVPEGLKPRRLA